MKIWKDLKHPNILKFIAASLPMEEPMYFLSPFIRHGNLVDFLQAIKMSDLEGVFGPILRKQNSGSGSRSSTQYPGMREQASHHRTTQDSKPLATLPLSKSQNKFDHGHILKEGDLWGFILDISRGMQYLHDQGVLHGDLKVSLPRFDFSAKSDSHVGVERPRRR